MANDIARQKGFAKEQLAADWLSKNGFEILDRNYSAKSGEIDIIATKDGVTHFVEVKSGESFEPIYAITPSKLKKVITTAQQYRQSKKIYGAYQIDACIVKGENVSLIENITM
jgi:putative endonuclease